MTSELRFSIVGTPDDARLFHCRVYPETEITIDPEEIRISQPGRPGKTYSKKPYERLVIKPWAGEELWKS